MASSVPMRSSSITGNDSSSSDNDDDERSSPASSAYFVASGAEDDLLAPGTRCLQQSQLRSRDEGPRETLQVERQNVDISVANHQDDNSDRQRSNSLLGAAPVASCTGSGIKTNMAGKLMSGAAEEKSCRPTTTLTTPKVGGAGNSGRTDLELLCRLFPHVPPVTIDCVLLSCAGNVVECIEQLLKFHQLKPSVDMPPIPVGANLAAAAAAAAAYASLPHAVPMYHHQRFVAPSSSVEPPAFPVPAGGAGSLNVVGGKPPLAPTLPLMPATLFNGAEICGSGSNNAGPRALQFGFPYPPAALLPTIAGLRYNYSAMMAAAAMATTGASGAAVPKTTMSGAVGPPLPYGLFAGGYKCTGSSAESDK